MGYKSIDEIKEHKFFEGMAWDTESLKTEAKKIIAPMVEKILKSD